MNTVCGSERETNREGEVAGGPDVAEFVLAQTVP